MNIKIALVLMALVSNGKAQDSGRDLGQREERTLWDRFLSIFSSSTGRCEFGPRKIPKKLDIITFDELKTIEEPMDGLTVKGVTFKVDPNVVNLEAEDAGFFGFNEVPYCNEFLQGSVGLIRSGAILTLKFSKPVEYVQFGFGRNCNDEDECEEINPAIRVTVIFEGSGKDVIDRNVEYDDAEPEGGIGLFYYKALGKKMKEVIIASRNPDITRTVIDNLIFTRIQ